MTVTRVSIPHNVASFATETADDIVTSVQRKESISLSLDSDGIA